MKNISMKNECWKRVPNYPHYDVSNWGNVRSWGNTHGFVKSKYRILKFWIDKDGYNTVRLFSNGKNKYFHVHCLVLIAFIGDRPKKLIACHNDGNNKNNKLDNLRWDTYISNEYDKGYHGVRIAPQNNIITNLRKKMKITQRDFAYKIGTFPSTVSRWELGETVPRVQKHIDKINFYSIKLLGDKLPINWGH